MRLRRGSHKRLDSGIKIQLSLLLFDLEKLPLGSAKVLIAGGEEGVRLGDKLDRVLKQGDCRSHVIDIFAIRESALQTSSKTLVPLNEVGVILRGKINSSTSSFQSSFNIAAIP